MVQRKSSPYSNFNFIIEIGRERGSSVVGGFEEIDGLGTRHTTARARIAWSAQVHKPHTEARRSGRRTVSSVELGA
jgi:hypothetical protein